MRIHVKMLKLLKLQVRYAGLISGNDFGTPQRENVTTPPVVYLNSWMFQCPPSSSSSTEYCCTNQFLGTKPAFRQRMTKRKQFLPGSITHIAQIWVLPSVFAIIRLISAIKITGRALSHPEHTGCSENIARFGD